MKFIAAIPIILGAALQAVAQVSDAAQAAALVADLKRAPTQVARLNILQNNKDVSTLIAIYHLISSLTFGSESVPL